MQRRVNEDVYEILISMNVAPRGSRGFCSRGGVGGSGIIFYVFQKPAIPYKHPSDRLTKKKGEGGLEKLIR